MTKVSHKISHKKILLWLIASFLAVILVLLVLEKTGVINLIHPKETSATVTGPTGEQKASENKANNQQKQVYLDGIYKDDSGSKSTVQPTVTPTVTVSAERQGSAVIILSKIQSVAEGSCRLVVTNSGKTTEQTAQVIYQPEFSSCAGFSVPVTALGSGSWNITVVVNPVGSGEISGTISLEVK